MPGLKKLKENIGRRWSLCSQNATQINFPRALLDTCPFCIESFYIEKKTYIYFLPWFKIFFEFIWTKNILHYSIKKTNIICVESCSMDVQIFFRYRLLCVYTVRPKMKRLQRMKKGCWCLCVSSTLNIFDNNAALLKCQYSYITLLIFPSTIIWRWRLVDHLHFVPGLSTIHSGDMRYNLFWIMHPTTWLGVIFKRE